MDVYPTPAEIEAVENYVYGVRPPSVEDLREQAGGAPLAIVVYAREYRPADGTAHRRHADMCFSRTGVARIGTSPVLYGAEARGYLPFVEGDGHAVRVLPCRYAAYIAARVPGHANAHGPMRFIEPGDSERRFWIPLHKLFSGDECLRGHSLTLRLTESHVNEKLRRVHLFFLSHGHDAGWGEPDISRAPFVITSGIAKFSNDVDDGAGLLVPQPRASLVERAIYNGAPLTFEVPETTDPPGAWRLYPVMGGSSLNLLSKPTGGRAAPEYVHVRHMWQDGQEIDLNQQPDMSEVIRRGGYRAQHYTDPTGDGWVTAECPELALVLPRMLPAYSLVATPDYLPRVIQSDLMRWTDDSAPPTLTETIWPEYPGRPEALSDQRLAANLELTGAGFERDDDTMTAIVGPLGSAGEPTQIDCMPADRVSTLPDAASGIFAPGWDVGVDRSSEEATNGVEVLPGVDFLATYGLGSPFPEDAKLCAALSSFWPAVAPDITRTFEPSPRYPTTTPLTDKLIGHGGQTGWDGVRGPIVEDGSVDYPALTYADYVVAARENQFDIAGIGTMDIDEYIARTLTTARAYAILGASTTTDKGQWVVLSFRPADCADSDLALARDSTGIELWLPYTYRFEIARHTGLLKHDDFSRRRVGIEMPIVIFADPSRALRRRAGGSWTSDVLRR
ncbi:hypothetical protein W59_23695 [Rhodococcus opacus RKJ300 = JCM 13270]|uniref:Uncharacterized protein n=1 Tax=Rhodococcus opacus RKJ300 = JCM 13270 TaxID=1165867 RepID=I0WLZ3_RHOOP|nr:hypothetical protein W59_23695 [Rhodococcus opacus RKJ300 = JCM 13270]